MQIYFSEIYILFSFKCFWSVFVSGGFLILLIFGYEIVHIGFGFAKFELIHSFASVPMKESFSPKHGRKLNADSFEEFLDGGRISDECGAHFETTGWDVAHGGFDVVGNPVNEIGGILVLNVEHLLIYLSHGHSAAKDDGGSEISAVAGIARSHHVFGVENLLSQFRDVHSSVLLIA